MRPACPQSTCITHRSMLDQIPYVVAQMRLSDIAQVMEIEREAFTAPWPARAYRYEIAENNHSTMLVVRPMLGSPGAHCGCWGALPHPNRGLCLVTPAVGIWAMRCMSAPSPSMPRGEGEGWESC